MLYLLEAGLATWRLSRMLVHEEGPNRIFGVIRERLGIEHSADGTIISWSDWSPLHCVFCTSVYAAGVVALLPRWGRLALAISGVASLIEECRLDGEAGRQHAG